MPGLLKVGKTQMHPDERADQLWTTGVPFPFRVEKTLEVNDLDKAERLAHQILSNARVHPAREFFEISLEAALECVTPVLSRGSIRAIDKVPKLATKISPAALMPELDRGIDHIRKHSDTTVLSKIVNETYSRMPKGERISYVLEHLPEYRWDSKKKIFLKKKIKAKSKPSKSNLTDSKASNSVLADALLDALSRNS
jgi:hypothetical protein